MDNVKIFAKKEKELATLLQTIRIYNQGMGMEFSIEKCAMLTMKRGKSESAEEIELPNALGQLYRRMSPWCNGYRRRKWTQRHKFKS